MKSLQEVEKTRKLAQGLPEGAQNGPGTSPVAMVCAAWVPGVATRATKQKGKRHIEIGKNRLKERRPVGEWKEVKVGIESLPEERKRDYGYHAFSELKFIKDERKR